MTTQHQTKKETPITSIIAHGDIRTKQNLIDGTYAGNVIDDVQLTECILDDFSFSFCVLNGFSFQDADIYNSIFNETHLDRFISTGLWHKNMFTESTMEACRFVDQNFLECRFLKHSIISGCHFTSVTFSGCDFEDVRFENCTFNDVSFINCVFEGIHSGLRPHLNTEVMLYRCKFIRTKFKSSKFLIRRSPNGMSAVASLKFSTVFDECRTSEILFTDCNITGLDTYNLNDCIFDTGSLLKEGSYTDIPKGPSRYLPDINNKAIGVDAIPLKPVNSDNNYDHDDYNIMGVVHGRYDGYGAYYNELYNTIDNNYNKPKNKGKAWAYRFYSSGIDAPKKAKA